MPDGSTGSTPRSLHAAQRGIQAPDGVFESRIWRTRSRELGRAAQRANMAFYTVDPRGLIATGVDASTRSQVSYGDFRDFIHDADQHAADPGRDDGRLCAGGDERLREAASGGSTPKPVTSIVRLANAGHSGGTLKLRFCSSSVAMSR